MRPGRGDAWVHLGGRRRGPDPLGMGGPPTPGSTPREGVASPPTPPGTETGEGGVLSQSSPASFLPGAN